MFRDCIAFITRFFSFTDYERTISLSNEIRLLLEEEASGTHDLQSIFGYCMDDLKDATISLHCKEVCWSLSRKELTEVLFDFYRRGVCIRNENVLSFLLFCLGCYSKWRIAKEPVNSKACRLLDIEKLRLHRILRELNKWIFSLHLMDSKNGWSFYYRS